MLVHQQVASHGLFMQAADQNIFVWTLASHWTGAILASRFTMQTGEIASIEYLKYYLGPADCALAIGAFSFL